MKYSKRAACFAAEFSNSQRSHWNPFPLESAFLSYIYYITTLFLKAYWAPLQKWQLGFPWTCIDLIFRLRSLCSTLWSPWWRFKAKRQAFRSLAGLLNWSISLPVTFPGHSPPRTIPPMGASLPPASGCIRLVGITNGIQREWGPGREPRPCSA